MNDEQRSLLLAVAISLLCHGVLLWFMPPLQKVLAPVESQPVLAVRLAPALTEPSPPPPPPPPPQPKPKPQSQPQPQPVAPPPPQATVLSTPAPTARRRAPVPAPVPEEVLVPPLSPAPPAPPRHRMKAAGRSAPASARAGANGGAGHHAVYAPPDYAEKVKTRVNAAIVYPADAQRFLQQCWVEYTLSVDRNGHLLDYRIKNCGDDRLDAAAQAALIKGGPYPPPPDSGAASYEIHGALVFTLP